MLNKCLTKPNKQLTKPDIWFFNNELNTFVLFLPFFSVALKEKRIVVDYKYVLRDVIMVCYAFDEVYTLQSLYYSVN